MLIRMRKSSRLCGNQMGRVSGEYAFDELRNWTIFDFFFTKPSKFPRLEARARARNFYSSIRLLLKLILYYIMHTPSLFLHTQCWMRFFSFCKRLPGANNNTNITMMVRGFTYKAWTSRNASLSFNLSSFENLRKHRIDKEGLNICALSYL